MSDDKSSAVIVVGGITSSLRHLNTKYTLRMPSYEKIT